MSDTHLWHPFADMSVVRNEEFVLARGEGAYVFDEDGNRYLDASASLWYCNVGHGRAEIADAAAEQLRTLETYHVFGDVTNRPARELAAKLAELSPMQDTKVFFTSGGGDAIDTAAKLARVYWQTLRPPDRRHNLARTHGYHGTMAFGTSIGGMPAITSGWGPLVPQTSQVQWDSAQALRDEIERVGADRVAAFFCEPVIGAGGVFPPPPGYLEEVAAICADTGVLLVVDAVITGFGRIGDWIGCERYGVTPDLVAFAKGVTSGYLPLGGVLVSGRVAEPFWEEPGNVVLHGQTYAGHASVCAAGLANIAIIEREGLVARARELEGEIYGALAELRAHPLVGDVRGGTGLMAAVELSPEVLQADPGAGMAFYRAIRANGVMTRAHAVGVAISPPLIITREQIGELAAAVQAGLERLAAVGATA